VRLGVVLEPPWTDDAVLAEKLGFDLVWVDDGNCPAPLVIAAGIGARTSGVRIAASVAAGPHPVTLAEEAAVADLASGGRLVLVVRGSDEESLTETVQLIFHAWAARPFRHQGPRFTVPAQLPEHDHAETRLRVTPTPAQLEPTVWLRGPAASAVARRGGVAPLIERADGDEHWKAAESALGLAAWRLRRPGLRPVQTDDDGGVDWRGLVGALLSEQVAWGMDVAVLTLPRALGAAARERALHTIATVVRPRVQIDRLPKGLEEHWQATRASERSR
jgi:hypothetical protein